MKKKLGMHRAEARVRGYVHRRDGMVPKLKLLRAASHAHAEQQEGAHLEWVGCRGIRVHSNL